MDGVPGEKQAGNVCSSIEPGMVSSKREEPKLDFGRVLGEYKDGGGTEMGGHGGERKFE